VSETNSSHSGAADTSALAQAGWTVLIVATLSVCYFSHLGAIGFVGPDEPRYAWIARDMAETGDWVTPRLYGKPWFEKPVLYYWGAAACFKLFGVSEAAARLPSAISALLATLALAWLAWRLYGVETARWLLLLLPTSVGMIGFSHAAATDMPFSGMLTIAMVCAAVVLGLTGDENTPILPRTPWLALLLFGFFLGLAVLAKGPAAIILSGGAVFFWAVFTKRWRDAFRLFHPIAIASFCLTALPWYILCGRRNPDFFRVFFIEHNFQRYLTPEFQHIQPFWFYLPVMLIALFPWTLSSLVFLKDAASWWKDGRVLDSQTVFLTSWPFFVVLFFGVSKSKLPGYVLPAVPPLILIVARSVSVGTDRVALKGRWASIISGVSLLAVGLLALFTGLQFDPPLVVAPLTIAMSGIAILVLGNLSRTVLVTVIATILVIGLTVEGNAREILDGRLSVRPATLGAATVWRDYSPERSSSYQLQRSFQYGLNFYLRRELAEWSPGKTQPGWVYAPANQNQKMRELGLECPFNVLHHAVIVCRDPRSTGGEADGGKAH